MVCDSRVRPMPRGKKFKHTTTPGHAPRVSHRHIVSRPARIGATHEASITHARAASNRLARFRPLPF
eukprot:3656223-Prymnesium_polylepis.1